MVTVNLCLTFSLLLIFKDAQDLGIGIELYPFNRPGEQFNVNIFYSVSLQQNMLLIVYHVVDKLELKTPFRVLNPQSFLYIKQPVVDSRCGQCLTGYDSSR